MDDLLVPSLDQMTGDPFGQWSSDALYGQIKGGRRKSLFAEMFKAMQAGKLSKNTFQELSLRLANDQTSQNKTIKEYSGKDGFASNAELNLMSPRLEDIQKAFRGEVEGSSIEGRSRLATQKMFQLMQDRPGRTQTLLAPRSNSSKSILGV